MKIYDSLSNEKNLFFNVTDVILPDCPKDRILIYDIDTTAFEPANGCVFLIGVVCFDGNELKIKQFFSEDIADEPVIIKEFLDFAKDYEVLLNYKGDSFDIPFISGRISNLRDTYKDLPDTSHIRKISLDLFNDIRPLKPFFNFFSTKLDTLRKFTGHKVTERITGENISTFYVQHISKTKLRNLQDRILSSENKDLIPEYAPKPVFDDLAHINPDNNDSFLTDVLNRNRDNMEAVLYICKLGHLFNMRKLKYDVSVETGVLGAAQNSIIIEREAIDEGLTTGTGLDVNFGKGAGINPGFKENNEYLSIFINLKTAKDTGDNNNEDSLKDTGSLLKIYCPIIQVSLKQFFINYKDYYYFPDKDMAIHKSVAEFTDKASRQKATIRTAYSNVSGKFVKVPSAYIKAQNKKEGCLYKESYDSEDYYFPAKNILGLNNDELRELAYYCVIDTFKTDIGKILIKPTP